MHAVIHSRVQGKSSRTRQDGKKQRVNGPLKTASFLENANMGYGELSVECIGVHSLTRTGGVIEHFEDTLMLDLDFEDISRLYSTFFSAYEHWERRGMLRRVFGNDDPVAAFMRRRAT